MSPANVYVFLSQLWRQTALLKRNICETYGSDVESSAHFPEQERASLLDGGWGLLSVEAQVGLRLSYRYGGRGRFRPDRTEFLHRKARPAGFEMGFILQTESV
jgi:hypothetical protein